MKLLYISVILGILFSCQLSDRSAEQAVKPNIVFLFTDDQTFQAVRALGNEEIHTPNIDRILLGGTSFTHAYNMGGWNGAICVASRAMMISGRSIWRANQFQEGWRIRDSVALSQTWAKLMEANGYDTYMTGKWHVLAPADTIFQEARHIRPGMPGDQWKHGALMKQLENEQDKSRIADLMPVGYNRPKSETDQSWSPTDSSFGGFWEGGQHWSEVVRDDAISFIKQAEKSDNPFFMYLAFNAPHDPRQAPTEFRDMYPVHDIALPENWLGEYPFKDEIGCSQMLRDEALAPFPRTSFSVRKHMQEYYAIITHLDQQVGLILDELKSSGQMQNTYIFFGSDHGLAIGKHGFLGKQNMYDHSIRVPMALLGPNIPAGQEISADVYLQDIMATSLDLAGIAKPDYIDFHSLLPLATGGRRESTYSAIYGAYIDLQRMIRKDNFKLIVYPKVPKVRLFDLLKDPHEMHDLSDDPTYRKKAESLFQDLLQLQETLQDPHQLTNVYEVWMGDAQ
ncbi:MAG: sulfatase-like hydrolase/transferase [Saprospiraceae bacterium]|nr:sulfatase-like hydrolase/transferase [Saprospiraceae bacterium]